MSEKSDRAADERGRRATAPDRARNTETRRQAATIRVESTRGQSDTARRANR